jgi:hypothetical protein
VFQAVQAVGAEIPTPQQVEDAMRKLSKLHTEMSVVGEIVDAWINANNVTVIAFKIQQDLTGVTFLIENGFARGLSLTHAESKQPQHLSKLVPYEVSRFIETIFGAFTYSRGFLGDYLQRAGATWFMDFLSRRHAHFALEV